jgi:hypothetical protein
VTSSSIYPLPHDTPPLEADYRKYPAEHSRSAGRAGLLKIHCLLNDPAPVFYKLAPGAAGCESKMPFHRRNKEMLHGEHGGMFADRDDDRRGAHRY